MIKICAVLVFVLNLQAMAAQELFNPEDVEQAKGFNPENIECVNVFYLNTHEARSLMEKFDQDPTSVLLEIQAIEYSEPNDSYLTSTVKNLYMKCQEEKERAQKE